MNTFANSLRINSFEQVFSFASRIRRDKIFFNFFAYSREQLASNIMSSSPPLKENVKEVLIDEVKGFPNLWNTSLTDFHDRQMTNNSWEQIAKNMERFGKDSKFKLC